MYISAKQAAEICQALSLAVLGWNVSLTDSNA